MCWMCYIIPCICIDCIIKDIIKSFLKYFALTNKALRGQIPSLEKLIEPSSESSLLCYSNGSSLLMIPRIFGTGMGVEPAHQKAMIDNILS